MCDRDQITNPDDAIINYTHKLSVNTKHIGFVDEFPMKVTGKLQKFHIHDTTIEKSGLTQKT